MQAFFKLCRTFSNKTVTNKNTLFTQNSNQVLRSEGYVDVGLFG